MVSQIISLTIICSIVYSRCRSKKTSKLRVTSLCEGSSPVNGEFPAQRASNAESFSIWWRHHKYQPTQKVCRELSLNSKIRFFSETSLLHDWIYTSCSGLLWMSNYIRISPISLQCRHNELAGVSNHQPHNCLLNRLFTRRSKKTSKLRVTGLCEGNSPVTGEFPAQRASYAENVSIW